MKLRYILAVTCGTAIGVLAGRVLLIAKRRADYWRDLDREFLIGTH